MALLSLESIISLTLNFLRFRAIFAVQNGECLRVRIVLISEFAALNSLIVAALALRMTATFVYPAAPNSSLKWDEALFYASKKDEATAEFARAVQLDLIPEEKAEQT